MRLYIYILCLLNLFLVSCEKQDEAVILPPPGPAQVADIEMGANYENQVFFDLDSGKTYTQKNADWDLAFESGKWGTRVRLNGGFPIKAAQTGSTDWTAFYDPKKYIFYSDAPNGNRDSTAVGNWADSIGPWQGFRSKNLVYLIDRGTQRSAERYKKLKLIYVSDDTYKIKYGNIDGTDDTTLYLRKSSGTNYIYFTFESGGKVLSGYEPDYNCWDIVFTSYAHVYHEYNPPLSYVVRGVLLNPRNVTAIADSATTFDKIDLAYAKSLNLVKDADAIGFGWKTYDGATGKFIIRSHITYVLRNRHGLYYKLRFMDFYNNMGQKGYPKFEFQRL